MKLSELDKRTVAFVSNGELILSIIGYRLESVYEKSLLDIYV